LAPKVGFEPTTN